MAKKKAARTPVKKAAKKAPKKAKTKVVKNTATASAPASTADLSKAFREAYTPPPKTTVDTVILDQDVAPHFRSSHAVNEALRALLRIVRQVRP